MSPIPSEKYVPDPGGPSYEPLTMKNEDDDDDDASCSICFEDLYSKKLGPDYSAKKISCNHIFHKHCLLEWEKHDNNTEEGYTCPLCKRVYKRKSGLIDDILQLFYSIMGSCIPSSATSHGHDE